MKKLFLLVTLGVFLCAGSAMALPTLDNYTYVPGDSVYSDTGASYVYLTELNESASAPMILIQETLTPDFDYILAIYGYDFSADTVTDIMTVMDSSDVNYDEKANVIFNVPGGTATSYDESNNIIDSAPIGTTFGFLLYIYGSPELIFSDPTLNDGADYCGIYHNPIGLASLDFAETAVVFAGGDEFVLFSVDDVAPAVPEPATMLLLGSGLIGLAAFGRKKFFKKN